MPSPEVRANEVAKAKEHVQTLYEKRRRSEESDEIREMAEEGLRVFVMLRKPTDVQHSHGQLEHSTPCLRIDPERG